MKRFTVYVNDVQGADPIEVKVSDAPNMDMAALRVLGIMRDYPVGGLSVKEDGTSNFMMLPCRQGFAAECGIKPEDVYGNVLQMIIRSASKRMMEVL